MPVSLTRALAVAAVLWLACAGQARAQGEAPFLAGKTVSMVIPAGPGGVYGLYGLAVAPYLRKHLPGQPQVVMQYMPGGGGIVAGNYIANVAPTDGTVLAMPHDSLVIFQVLQPEQVRYDARRWQWLGTIGGLSSTLSIWHTAPARTVEDARQQRLVIGATGRGSYMYMAPRLMNELMGTRFELVTGYKGIADIDIAMERGEVQGRGGNWLGWKSAKADWLRDGKIVHLVQIGHAKAADLPGVPLLTDLGRTDTERQMYRFVSSVGLIGRSLALPPATPPERVAVWRRALAAALADAEFIAEARARNIDIEPIAGPDIERAIGEILATPADVVGRLRAILGGS